MTLADAPNGRALELAEAEALLAATGLVLSREVPPESVEVVIGVQDDPSFGAIEWFGIAGVAVELLDDRAYAAVPLTSADADELVRAPRAAPLLTGYSGGPAMDLVALTEVVLRISALADVELGVIEDEFADNAARFNYPAEVLVKSRLALEELIALIEGRAFPFSDLK